MEKRKLYIITALIIISLLSGLSFWYLYIIKQKSNITKVTNLDIQGPEDKNAILKLPPSNPFGENSTTTTIDKDFKQASNTEQNAITSSTTTTPIEKWELIQIYDKPVAGYSIAENTIKFIDKSTGNINEWFDNNIIRLSGITIQKVQDAYVLSDSSTLITQNSTSTPVLIKIKGEEATTESTNMDSDILQSAQSRDTIYYTKLNNSGELVLKNSKSPKRILWTFDIPDWLIQATNKDIVITQKASYNIPGYSYLLNKDNLKNKTAQLKPIIRDTPGLITNVSPDSQQVLYSSFGKKQASLNLKQINNNKNITLSVITLANKCSWGNDSLVLYCAIPKTIPQNIINKLPDIWYKGEISFNDDLWKIDTKSGDALRLARDTTLDIINIKEGDGLIVFTNKIDQSLWAMVRSNKE